MMESLANLQRSPLQEGEGPSHAKAEKEIKKKDPSQAKVV